VWILALGVAGCVAVPDRAMEERMLTGEIELTVYGLSCPLCAGNLDRHLQKLPGLNELWPDLDTGAVRLTLHEGYALPVSAFREAVRDAGFTLQSARMVEDSR
jgi:copper chaperone CopZ